LHNLKVYEVLTDLCADAVLVRTFVLPKLTINHMNFLNVHLPTIPFSTVVTRALFLARVKVKVSVEKLVGMNYGTLRFPSVLLGYFPELSCKWYILYSFIK
jgi:hypothetical protein